MLINQIQWQPALTCASDTKTSAVRKLLDGNNSDSILLTDGGVVVGCLQTSDLDRRELKGRTEQAVGTFAHACTFYATPEMDAGEVLAKMRRRYMPVVPIRQNSRLVGMVSQSRLASSAASSTT